MKSRICAIGIAACALAPSNADAFCGFYVSGADSKLFNDATQVALMRDGTRTVLSMQNDYKGPPEDFALVVPVPVVLQQENVKTLPKEIFQRLDTLTAPRLVEYWEQDPCATRIGTLGHGAGTGTGQGFGSGSGRLGGSHNSGVTIEAQFEVGEYEIVILSAKDSSGLDSWLKENKYKIPDNAEPALRPYVQAGSKFFVAKVNVAKVKFEEDPQTKEKRASLSPLRFHYDTDKLELPVKLGLLNSAGTQDLIVYVIGGDRYAVANYPNVTIPTNLDVAETARSSFGAFYASLYDRTLSKNPNAVVTEYSWGATSCDPCPGALQGVSPTDLASLGGDVMPGVTISGTPSIRQGATKVNGRLPPEVIQRIVRQNFGRFRLCGDASLGKTKKPLNGTFNAKFVISGKGEVSSTSDGGDSSLTDPTAGECLLKGFSGMTFPEPEDKKPVTVVYPVIFSPGIASVSKQLTITRLHARYTKDSLGNDLVFNAAEPIVGGREIYVASDVDGGATSLEHNARPVNIPGGLGGPSLGGGVGIGRLGASGGFVSGNNFQARYAIRHPWPGAITCKEPVRNIWGAKWPADADANNVPPDDAKKVETATKLAYVTRNASLASFTTATAAQLDGTTVNPDGGVVTTPAGADAVSTDGGGAADGGTAGGKSPSKCGCRVVSSGDHTTNEANAFGVLLLGMLATARRYRRRDRDEGTSQ